MKRARYLGVIGLFLLPILMWVGVASAQSFRTGDNTMVTVDEVVDSSLYASGRTIDIAGEVKGDVFCAGQNVTVSGTVRGDVICAGQTLRISGKVEGDVRAAGQTVSIGGEVKGNVSAASQSFTLESKGKVGGDVAVGGDDAVLNGTVGRDVSLGSATVVVANTVGRNLKASTENLTLSERAVVGGDLTYTSKNDATVTGGARVKGTTHRYEPQQENRSDYGKVFGFGFGTALYVVLSLLLVALALALLFPHALHDVSGLAAAAPLKTFLVGLGASFGVPVIIVGLMVSVIGIPLGLLVLLSWLLVLFLAGPFFGYYLGRLIWRTQKHPVLIMLVGSLLVLVAYLVPILGAVTFMAAIWMGSGMLLRSLFHRTPKPSYNLAPAKTTHKK